MTTQCDVNESKSFWDVDETEWWPVHLEGTQDLNAAVGTNNTIYLLPVTHIFIPYTTLWWLVQDFMTSNICLLRIKWEEVDPSYTKSYILSRLMFVCCSSVFLSANFCNKSIKVNRASRDFGSKLLMENIGWNLDTAFITIFHIKLQLPLICNR